jgi:hypothetical protein
VVEGWLASKTSSIYAKSGNLPVLRVKIACILMVNALSAFLNTVLFEMCLTIQ